MHCTRAPKVPSPVSPAFDACCLALLEPLRTDILLCVVCLLSLSLELELDDEARGCAMPESGELTVIRVELGIICARVVVISVCVSV